jgi:hypothetical protein
MDTDFADQAADAVIKVVDTVRDKTTGPILTAARAIVYGLIGLMAVIVAVIVLAIAFVRLADSYLPGNVWFAHLLIGALFTVGGLFAWHKRYAPSTD